MLQEFYKTSGPFIGSNAFMKEEGELLPSLRVRRMQAALRAARAALRKRVNLRHVSICVPKQMPQRGRNRHPVRLSVSPSDHGKIFCLLKKFFVNTFNNQLRVPKPRLSESALSSEQSATFSHCRKAAMLACALRSSSSQKSRSALARCDFREHV